MTSRENQELGLRSTKDSYSLYDVSSPLSGTRFPHPSTLLRQKRLFFNRPFPSCFEPHYESEAKCKFFAFDEEERILIVSFLPKSLSRVLWTSAAGIDRDAMRFQRLGAVLDWLCGTYSLDLMFSWPDSEMAYWNISVRSEVVQYSNLLFITAVTNNTRPFAFKRVR